MGLLDTLVADAREAFSKFTAQIPKPPIGALSDLSSQPAKDPHFFFGQPVTTGPYPMVVGTPQEISDPNVATAKRSRYVQIQNATGCVLNVQTGVGSFTIQALAASTVPTDYGMPVILNPTSGYTNFSQYVTIVWLLDGQSSPMADGSINAPYTPGTPTTTSINFTFTSGTNQGPSQVLPAPSAGSAYVFNSAIFSWVSGGPTGTLNFNIYNVTTTDECFLSSVILSSASPGPFAIPPYNADTQADAIDVVWTNPGASCVAKVSLNYFVVSI